MASGLGHWIISERSHARLRWRALAYLCVSVSIAAPVPSSLAQTAADSGVLTIDARAWRLIERQSGPVNYYGVVNEGNQRFVRSRYLPPMKSALLGWQTPDRERSRAKKLRWSWRARVLPTGGDECTPGKGDSAAVVYATWKRGLRYYTLKYVWSATGVKGQVCARKRNLFVAQDTIILQSGGPLDVWSNAEIDLKSEFRNHFEQGDPSAQVPDFVGLGIMSDGDQTHSESSADFGTFSLSR